MKTRVYLLLMGLICFSQSGHSQQDSLPFEQEFWQHYVRPLVDGERSQLDTLVHFPLAGDWGHIMKLEKQPDDWNKEDFYSNYTRLFNTRIKEIILKKGHDQVQIYDWEDGPQEVVYSISWHDYGFESQILLRYRKIDHRWMLTNIQGAG